MIGISSRAANLLSRGRPTQRGTTTESQIISDLVNLMEEASGKGFQYPMAAGHVSADASILVAKWKILNNGDPDFESKFASVTGPMKVPINIMLVDAYGKGARALMRKAKALR